MKKLLSIMLAVITVFALAVSAGCTVAGEEEKAIIRLRSAAEQSLKVGDSMEIVYSLHNNKSDEVIFEAENEKVVEVDRFGNVDAVGVGESNVTLTLAEDTSVSVTLHYTVTKNFFMTDDKYYNGSVNLKGQDAGGDVLITGGQSQVLANAEGEEWYFKTHLTYTGQDSNAGAWGVGSFLVNGAHKLGDIMYWYEFRKKDENRFQLYYGGYRFDSTLVDAGGHWSAPVSADVIDVTEGVDVTIYRKGVTHYFVVEYKDNGETKSIKHSYDVELFKGLTTFPGAYGQNQRLIISDYESSNNVDEVEEKILSFQKAEEITINGVDDRLIAGTEYNLTSTILPSYTTDKNITYTLKAPLEGVNLTPDGKLTVADGANGSVTVVATATNAPTVTEERTYTVAAKPASTSEIFDTGMKIGDVEFNGNGLALNGRAYAPLICNSENWYVSADINLPIENSDAGIIAATNGYTQYFSYLVNQESNKAKSGITFGDFNGRQTTIAQAADGKLNSTKNTLGLLKNGSDLLVFINGKQIKRYVSAIEGNLIPVIYCEKGSLTVKNVEIVTEKTALDEIIAANAFSVGKDVTVTGDGYKLSDKQFTGKGDINWPPVNDYENGLKFNTTIKGGCTIEFKMSQVKPKALDTIDSKILVYLKSETTTCSIQFVIKDRDGDGVNECKMCINLNDASWSEHDIPAELESAILTGEVTVKIVKTMTGVELYLNGTRLYEGRNFMDNYNYWDAETLATPGIGSYNCGAVISDIKLTK